MSNLQKDSDNARIYTATFTPTADVSRPVGRITLDLTKLKYGYDMGGRLAGVFQSAEYTVDTTPPDAVLDADSGSVGQVSAAWQPGTDGSNDTWEVALNAPGAGATSTNNPISVNLAGVNTRVLVNGLRDGMLSHFTSTGDGSVWTATLSAPTRNVTSSNNTFRVNMAGVNDRAGNAGEGGGATGVNYSLDAVAGRPSLRITLADSTLTVGESTTVTFSFNEAVTGFDATDIVLTSGNGTLSNLAVGADGKTWTATFTPTANTEVANNTVSVDLAGVRNAAGVAGVGSASSANYVVDTVRPMLRSLVIDDRLLAANEETTVTITFSQAIDANSFTLDDLEIIDSLTQRNQSINGLRGTLSNLRTTDGGTTWKLTLRSPSADNMPDNRIAIKLRDIADAAGNTVGGGNVPGDPGGTYIANDQAYANDSSPPQVSGIAVSSHNLRSGGTLAITVTFNEPVTGFSLDDIYSSAGASGGTMSGLNSSEGGKIWSITLSAPTFRTSVTWAKLSVVMGAAHGIRDLAGNMSREGGHSGGYYNVDTRDLVTATITLADNHLMAGETTTVTIVFNDRVNGFTADDVVLTNANGTLGPLTANADGKTWTATFTPTANVHSARNTISVNLFGVTDAVNPADTTGFGQSHSASYSVSTVRPGATITLGSTSLTMRETTTVRFAFSEAVTGFTEQDIVLSDANGTLGPLTADADGKTWTATFTPTANVLDASNTIRVNLAGVSNAAGNTGEGTASSADYAIDTTAERPTAIITLADTDLRIDETTTVTIVFNGPVNGFTADDVVLSDANGTLGPLTGNALSTIWTATFTPTLNVQDTSNTIRVNLAGVTNRAGRAGFGSATSVNYQIDTIESTRPSASITLSDSALKIGETSTVTIRFNAPVLGFTADDVDAPNGTLGPLVADADGRTWSATFTPNDNTENSSNAIRVNLAGVTNTVGRAGLGHASSADYQVDTTRPSVRSITLADSKLSGNEATTVTIVFSEALDRSLPPTDGKAFTLSDLTIFPAPGGGGIFSDLRSDDGITWQCTLTAPPADGRSPGSNRVLVNLSGVTDPAGNQGEGSAFSAPFSYDLVRPTVRITLSDTDLTVGESASVTFTFSERVTGFTLNEVVLTSANGTLSHFTPDTVGRNWTATFTPTANISAANNTIGVNLSRVRDDAGNAGEGLGSSASYQINTLDPTRLNATITLADTRLTPGETTTVTFRFSERVTGFTSAHVVLSDANGTLGPLTADADGRTWSATFTPAANVDDATNTIRVNLAGATGATGRAGDGHAISTNYSVHTTRPGASITLADTQLTAGQTTTVRFAFSETVNGFTAADVVLSDANGTLGPLTANADGKTWSATFTPRANTEDSSNTIRVNLAGVSNAAGNAGADHASSANYRVDTLRPSATITLADTRLSAGESTTVTFAFSEAVTGFDASDVVLSEATGTLGPLAAGSDGKTWTATFTPTANVNAASNRISVNLAGVADAAGNAGVGNVSSAQYSVHTAGPTASITVADDALTTGETTTVSFTFNEPVTGLDASDVVLSDANGTLGPITPNAARTVWTAIFTPTAHVSDATNTIGLNLAGVRNDAGNAGTGNARSANYSVDTRDTTGPTATVTLEDSALTAGESTTVTIRFSEPVRDFDASDIVYTHGTLSWPTANAERTVWTATFTPTANVNAEANTLRVDLTGVRDDAGNAGVGSASSNYSVHTTRPTATVVLADSALTAGESTTVRFGFSEPVTGLDASDIVCTSGTLSAPTPNAERTVWTATFTPAANVSAGTNTIHLDLTGVRNDAGNAGIGSASSTNYSVDTRTDSSGPTVTITLADTALSAGETTTVSFRFDEPVNGLDASDVVCTSGTLSAPTANAERTVWTASFTPTANTSAGANTIRVDLAGVRDDVGNAGTGSAISANYSVDTERPTVSIALADSALSAGETTSVSFRFSEPVNGLDASDIVCTSGTLSAPTANAERTVWTSTFTPTDNTNAATNTIRVNLANVRDDAGNAGTDGTISANYSVHTTRPTATVVLADSALSAGETTSVSFRFSEPVNGLDASDIVCTSGTLSAPTANAERTLWTATFTPAADTTAPSNTIRVNLAGVSNDAGNAGTGRADSSNYSVDTTRPTATIALANTALTAGQTTTVSITFSEPVKGFDASDIVCTGGTLSWPTASADRTVWTATLTPTANTNAGANTLRVNLAGVTDAAGNAGVGRADSANYSVHTTRPTATITLADSALSAGETTTVTLRFNEPVTGLDASDIVCSNGTLSAPTANAERTLWTATLTPTANVSAPANTLRLNLAGVSNDAGNAGTDSALSANYSVDTRADTTGPTATITLADTALSAGETTTVSFRFNEPVTDLDASDIVCPNGTLSAPTANAERTLWTATFTPTANANVPTNTIRVNLAGVRDDAGNAGTGSAISTNYSVDTRTDSTGPTATITLADSTLSAGETTTVTITFNEPVTGLDASAIVCPSGTLTTPTANAERTVWTATLTPTANTNAGANTLRVNLAGVRDDAGNAGVGSAESSPYSVHTTRPTATVTLADSALTAGQTTTLTITFSEPVNGFDASDIVYTNGTLGWPTASAERTVWTATLTPTANVDAEANTIRVNLAGVRNDAGNAGVDTASSTNYSVHTTRPTATIVLADSALTAGESTTVTITFNKPVNGLDASDIVCMSGTLSAPTANAERTVWTATLTPTANANAGANTIHVNLAGVTDDAGNTGTGSAISANYSVDTVRLTATIALADTALTAGETTTVTITFNKPVNGLDTSDIVCPNGTLSAPTANAERTVWTATLTPTANANAPTNTIRVNLAGVTDDAGSAGTGSAISANYSVDTRTDSTGLTATITLADTALTVGESTTVTITFNKPVNGLDASDIVCPNGTLSAPTANAERTVWTATLTPTANANAGANTIRVNLAGVTDDAGTAGTGSAISTNYSVDTTRPTATITLADTALTADKTTTVTITFNEPVTGFDASDIVCTSGTLSPPTANTERTVWTATLAPTADTSAPANTIRVNLSGVRDDAGNTGTGSAESANYSVDTKRPTATITLADTALTADKTTTVTITFNEPVTGFDASDILCTSGTLSPPTANTERTVWTATLTPTADTSAPANTIRVNLSGVRDDAGNAGTGRAESANYSVDTKRPTATITLADSTLTAGKTTTVTISFSEPVTGLDTSDIVCMSGTLSPPTANAGRTVWTATFTPTANVSALANTIHINLGGVIDDTGNAGTGSASSDNYSVDTTRPTATITLADSALTVGKTTTVSFRFSESVTGFDTSDIVCPNGTLSPPTANAGRTVWTATFTPTANVNALANTIRVNLAGITDDAGNTGTGSADSANYSVDTRPADTAGPTATVTLADTHLTIGDTTTVTFAFNEPVTGFTRDDVVLSEANGTFTDPTTNDHGRTWTATFTPTAGVENSSNTISVNQEGVRNAAGRAGTGHAHGPRYQIDTRAPVLASATVNASQLVLRYTEGTSLDATHIPPTMAFTVRVDNVLTAVTAIAVGAQEKTVSLTLATAVTNGQAVSLAYTDPTTGNDANAIQDAAGNDAASFAATPVDNHTPAPPGPAPSPSPNPAPSPSPSPPEGPAPKDSKDTDGDSIPDSLEDPTPGLPGSDGAVPVAGDGNGDGVQDGTQAAVGSTSARVRATAERATSTPVTLVAGSQDGKVDPDSGARITRLAQEDAPAQWPDGMEMPLGLLSFRATLAAGRSSEKFSLYLDPALGVNGYWVQDGSGTWVNLSSAAYGGKMGSEGGRLRLDFEISDGGPFDADGQANGAITAPGAPAQMQLSVVGLASDLASNGFWL
ncbi:Ig-like domain-containing protein [Verminephrobacter aporrectodeae]|uniref:Ig-like domain-containing protein n=1 Tax=Verminephrobacter aporrectodeae TaxID=1110389 RepID=UPI002238E356|nr:Ig-like domain-containing protein [Verminephrobacter aporrectodeae]